MRVVGVEIVTLARTLADLAEGQFAQTAQLAHEWIGLRSGKQEQLLAVGEISEFLAPLQIRRDLICATGFCQRQLDRRNSILLLADTVHILAHEFGGTPG